MSRVLRRGAAAWLAPCLAYIAIAGTFGVTTEVALDDMTWQELLLWTTLAYVAISAVLWIGFGARLRLVPAARWGALAGALVVATLVTLALALEEGEVSQVIPVAASYPVFTVALAVPLLRERLTVRRLAATALVICGVIVISLG